MQTFHMNGCGNTFVIFDARRQAFRPKAEDVRAIAAAGAQCDQLIVLEAPSGRGDVFMRIWNADGSEVSACGNASRCVGWLMMRETGAEQSLIETEAGLLKATRAKEGLITVDMGSPLLKWEEIPLAERMDTRRLDVRIGPIDNPYLHSPAACNVGNPHCTFFVEDVSRIDVARVGPLIEGHMLFPERVNVGFAQVLDVAQLRLRVWERGAGLTKACGTGACAAVVNAHRRGLIGRKAEVILDGGALLIEWRETDDRILMTGPVELTSEAVVGG
jgi:diaminopimelate epimerase